MRASAILSMIFVLLVPILIVSTSYASTGRLHYRPQTGYMGDVHPVFFNGRYYLPHLTANQSRTRLFVSALLVSDDLIRWEELPIEVSGMALHTPGQKDPNTWRRLALPTDSDQKPLKTADPMAAEMQHMIQSTVPRFWLVTVFHDPVSKRLFAFYPYNDIRMLVSDDMQHWDLYFFNPILRNPGPQFTEFRDPYVFWNEDDDNYWMILTTSLQGEDKYAGGAVSYARSKDLIEWNFEGVLYHPGNVGSPECPEMFRIGDQWYIVAGYTTPQGTVGATSYVMSDEATGPWHKPATTLLAGSDHIVGNTLFDGEKRYLFGWIPTYAGSENLRRPEWGGDLALPRELYAGEDGRLYTRLPDQFDSMRGRKLFPLLNDSAPGDHTTKQLSGSIEVYGDRIIIPDRAPYGRAALPGVYDRFDVEMEITLGSDTISAGITFDKSLEKVGLELGIDLHHQRMIVRRHGDHSQHFAWQPIDIQPNVPMKLRVIVEDDILEAFLDDRFSLSARLTERIDGHRITFYAEGGGTFSDIRVHEVLPQ